jgi:hypothetical protein
MIDVGNDQSWDELRAEFGEQLGLADPVPGAVLRRAMVDKAFAHRLLVSRGSPAFLAALIEDPVNRRYEIVDAASAAAHDASTPGNAELARRAATAVMTWGKAGFTHVGDDVFEARLAACEACPQLRDPPDRLAYKIRARRNADMRVCGLCGCVVARKARMATETCPGADPADPSRNRWGQEIAEAS